MNCRRRLLLLCLALGAFFCSGCGKDEDPRVYDADKTTRPVVFNTPDGWFRASVDGQFGERYAWVAADAGQGVRITISDFESNGQLDLLAHYNRWRKQIRLEPATTAEMEQQVKQRKVDGIAVHVVDIQGADARAQQEVILGAIFTVKKRTWFLKLRGPADAARSQQATFDAWAPRAVAAINHAVRDPAEEELAHGA